ncbi:MAG: exodeoxyribonuclease III [Burkholderiaceae bacterium]|nr:exodeoxyribonuclease III [Burkholderiaceae bacterium]
MIRVVTLNLNGIRSAARRGWIEWANAQAADVVCVQEVRAQECDIDDTHSLAGLRAHFDCGQRKGYSGVGVFSRRKPRAVRSGFGSAEFDGEGRYLELDFGSYAVVSVYVPSGSSSPERQMAKFRFLAEFQRHLRELRASGREVILCGDWNIAHREIDLKNWRSNRKNSGFLPEEREWIGQLFDEVGFVDVFRRLDARPEQYTWWSNRGQAWAKNVGWRIDYQIATPGIAAKARRAQIYTAHRFSDHAPLTIEYAVR